MTVNNVSEKDNNETSEKKIYNTTSSYIRRESVISHTTDAYLRSQPELPEDK